MLKTKLIHPDILEVLGRAGHGSKVLIADGNFPALTKLGPNATLVNLNLSPGVVSGIQALEAVVSAIPIESVTLMQYPTTGPRALSEDPPIWPEYKRILQEAGFDTEFEKLERFAFYDAASGPDTALIIHTAEQLRFANIMLTIGVVTKK